MISFTDPVHSRELTALRYQRVEGEYILTDVYIPSHKVGFSCDGKVFKSDVERYEPNKTVALKNCIFHLGDLPRQEVKVSSHLAFQVSVIAHRDTPMTRDQQDYVSSLVQNFFPANCRP